MSIYEFVNISRSLHISRDARQEGKDMNGGKGSQGMENTQEESGKGKKER